MKTTSVRIFSIAAFAILLLNFAAFGQYPTTSNQTETPEVQQARAAIAKVLDDTGRSFREGLLAIRQNRRSDAGENFDKAVEVFLYSTINIQKDQKLQSCYNQLIETVYRLEFPNDAQPAQIREL